MKRIISSTDELERFSLDDPQAIKKLSSHFTTCDYVVAYMTQGKDIAVLTSLFDGCRWIAGFKYLRSRQGKATLYFQGDTHQHAIQHALNRGTAQIYLFRDAMEFHYWLDDKI